VTRENGDRSGTLTGSEGKTASRTVDRSADGTTVTRTGPEGKTVTKQK